MKINSESVSKPISHHFFDTSTFFFNIAFLPFSPYGLLGQPLNLHFQTFNICSLQSMHMIRTALVARTLFPQQGHCSFLVLLGFLPGTGALPLPALLPPLAGGIHPHVPRFMLISVHPLSMMYSTSSSLGVVIVHPYVVWCSMCNPRRSASSLNRLL